MTIEGVINETLVKENARLRRDLDNAEKMIEILQHQANRHNDLGLELRLLRQDFQNLLSLAQGPPGPPGPMGPKGDPGRGGRRKK